MKKIALIEDEAFIQDFVSGKLMEAGYTVSACGDGEAAVQHIVEHTPDVVLLDLDLPNLSGHEILEVLQAEETTKTIPVIIFSNNDDPVLKERVMAAGAKDFYMKAATNPAELMAKIESV